MMISIQGHINKGHGVFSIFQRCRNAPFRFYFNIYATLLILFVIYCRAAYGQSSGDMDLEYRVKAAFLLNFTKFVTWPDNSSDNPDKFIIVCVLGNNPFGRTLETIQGKEVSGRPIKLVYTPDVKNMPYCHVVFVGEKLSDATLELLRKIRGLPVLTVGDTKGFAKAGGMINFINVDNKIRFEINASAVETASLKMSSQLLKLAVIVEDGRNGGN